MTTTNSTNQMAAETGVFGGPVTDMKTETVSGAVDIETVQKPDVGVDDTSKKPRRFWWFRPSKRLTRKARKLKSKMKKMLKKLKRSKSQKSDSQDSQESSQTANEIGEICKDNQHPSVAREYASSSVYSSDEEDKDAEGSDCDDDVEAEIFTPKFYNTPCTTNGISGHIDKPKEVLSREVILPNNRHWSAATLCGLMVLCSKMEQCQWNFDKLAVTPAAWKLIEMLETEQMFHEATLVSYFSSSFRLEACGVMVVRMFGQTEPSHTTRFTQKLICGSWPKLICAAPTTSAAEVVVEPTEQQDVEVLFEIAETDVDTDNECETSAMWAYSEEEYTQEGQWEDSDAETVVGVSDSWCFENLEELKKEEEDMKAIEVDQDEDEQSELVSAALDKFPKAKELESLDKFFQEDVAVEQPKEVILDEIFLQNLLDGLSDEDSSDSEDWDESDESDESDDEMDDEVVVATKAHKHQQASRSHTNSTPETRWRSLDEVYGFNGDIDCLHKELVIAGDFCTFNEDVIQQGHADYRETAQKVFEKLGEAIKTVQRQNLRKFADDSVAAFEFVSETFDCGLGRATKCAAIQKKFDALDSSDREAVLTLLVETQMELGELDLWQSEVQLAVQKGEHVQKSVEGTVDWYRCSTLQCADRAQRVIDQYFYHFRRVLVPALGDTSEAEIHSMHGFESGKFEDMRRLWVAEKLTSANMSAVGRSVEALVELSKGIEESLKVVCHTLLKSVAS